MSGQVLPALATLRVLLSVPCVARANSGNEILETMGISTAVGTVLGASTLPFYNQPEDHLKNLAYGASAGAVVGLGILFYRLFEGSPHDVENAEHAKRMRFARMMTQIPV